MISAPGPLGAVLQAEQLAVHDARRHAVALDVGLSCTLDADAKLELVPGGTVSAARGKQRNQEGRRELVRIPNPLFQRAIRRGRSRSPVTDRPDSAVVHATGDCDPKSSSASGASAASCFHVQHQLTTGSHRDGIGPERSPFVQGRMHHAKHQNS